MPFRSTDARLTLNTKNRLDPGPLGLCLEPVYQSLNQIDNTIAGTPASEERCSMVSLRYPKVGPRI
ncbi:hypothetical protein EG68_11983 [Paragonimus skrjabini miyazakii]|uniref:Uncharacterized protein n=1 Tax=Paragonimus skrjabini miyazakii TaxID=59628 RepID=A0A8S9YDP0_9TREM|nr:hypothetical protein EG68_11983 [Paragonimus skrjabini miyazakii]